MRDESRVWLIGACYGLWAGVCAMVTFAAVAALWSRFWKSNRSISGELIEVLPDVAITAIVAAISWTMLPRSRQPGPLAYMALAIAIVVVAHIVFVVHATLVPSGPWPPDPLAGLLYGFLLLVHSSDRRRRDGFVRSMLEVLEGALARALPSPSAHAGSRS